MTSTAATGGISSGCGSTLFCGLVIHGGVSQLALIGGRRPTTTTHGGPRTTELTPNGGEEGSGGGVAELEGGMVAR